MSDDPWIGRQVSDYRIESLLGRGGQGVVYLAEHAHLGKKVALKLLSPDLVEDASFRERFVNEARLAASLDHPNILDVYDAGEAEGQLFLAQRYVHGSDLARLVRAEGPLSPERTFALLAGVGSALDFAHTHGLVHRDVKPGNVLIEPPSPDRPFERVYLADFGLTKRVAGKDAEPGQGGLTRAGYFVGTPDYAAPEQIEGRRVDGRADQYALACMVYQCLTGELPFQGTTETAILVAHATRPPPRVTAKRPDLPAEIDRVVARGMSKDPSRRFPGCLALVEAARTAAGPSSGRPAFVPRAPAAGAGSVSQPSSPGYASQPSAPGPPSQPSAPGYAGPPSQPGRPSQPSQPSVPGAAGGQPSFPGHVSEEAPVVPPSVSGPVPAWQPSGPSPTYQPSGPSPSSAPSDERSLRALWIGLGAALAIVIALVLILVLGR